MIAVEQRDGATKVLQGWRELIDLELATVGSNPAKDSERLKAAASYVLQGQGKRLRGLLAMAIHSDISRDQKEPPVTLGVAFALEMLHAASLVHDDLPALDNDDVRRGRPSCHRAFNEATAILTGDFLVGRAFSVVAGGALSPMQQLRVLARLAPAWADLCVGQQVDIEQPKTPEEVHRLMELKTGALFGVAAAAGAICADLTDEDTQRFYDWGVRVGVLFQRLDDIADGQVGYLGALDTVAETRVLLTELRGLRGHALPLAEEVFHWVTRGQS